jgi:molybdenum cofactor biosynthesis enzyme MoaA
MEIFPEIQKKKALIKLDYRCNNNCLFCWTDRFGDNTGKILELSKIKQKILKAKKLGVDTITLSGGEPTIRKDFFKITKFIKEQGLSLSLGTNARMLSSDNFFQRLLNDNLEFLHISFYSTKKEIHNKISQTESFEQTIQGIKNSVKYGIEPIINIIVNKYNLDELEQIVDFLNNISVKKIKFSLVEPAGKALRNQDILPDIKTASENTKKAIDKSISLGIMTGFDGFPLCNMKGYEKRFTHLEKQGIIFLSEAFEDDFFPVDLLKYKKIKECNECLENKCPGIYEGYVNHYDSLIKNIKPILKKN